MDPRKRRTRKRLRASLLEMMKTDEIDDIRVIDLVERADIALPTFYRNYKNKQDLLHDMVLHITEHFDSSIYNTQLSIQQLLQSEHLVPTLPLFIYIEQEKHLFRQLLQTPYVHLILHSAHATAKETILRTTPDWSSQEVDLIVGCILGNVYQWILLDLPITAEQFAQKIHHITLFGTLLAREENTTIRQSLRANTDLQ